VVGADLDRAPVRAALALLAALAACGGDDGASIPDAAHVGDAPTDGGPPSTCTGACSTTALTATFGATTRTLDRAYYGINADASLHVEAYQGGDAGCPTMDSATPAYTVILGAVTLPAPGSSPGNLLDFTGDLLGGAIGAQATMVTVTPIASDASAATPFVALDTTLTFDAGTITGHVFATHCASLDE
jgi:hypothetical protein